jgi:hypothetical protein
MKCDPFGAEQQWPSLGAREAPGSMWCGSHPSLVHFEWVVPPLYLGVVGSSLIQGASSTTILSLEEPVISRLLGRNR